MSDIQKGAYRVGGEVTVTELELRRRSEVDRLRYILRAIADFPYIGEKAAQQMQLMAKGALGTTAGVYPEGCVSVELLNLERAVADDLREQNAKLRATAQRPLPPREIPEDLIDRSACAMCGFNDIMQGTGRMWADVQDPERGHWLALAKAGIIAIAPKICTVTSTEDQEPPSALDLALDREALTSTDCAPSEHDGGWPPPFELMKLQARKLGGDWIDIYPAQLEQMIRGGCAIRAILPDGDSAA